MNRKKCQREKVHKVMGEYKRKKLTSHKRPVTKRSQAIAIALSEARRKCK